MLCRANRLAMLGLLLAALVSHGCGNHEAVSNAGATSDEADGVYDVCVYGASSAGVMAAVQVARMGKRVVLIARDEHVGGLTTSGLTATDMNRYEAVGGLAREFYQSIYVHYERPDAWRVQDRDAYFASVEGRVYSGKNDELGMQWVYESHVAEKIMRGMLAASGVELVTGEQLLRPGGVIKASGAIDRIIMESSNVYRARVYVDASYEGDLMSLSGVTYTIGREPRERFGERLAGFIANDVFGRTDGVSGISIDPYVKPGVPESGLLPFVDPAPIGTPGEGDSRVQAYCYRLTLTDDPDNRRPIAKPVEYNELWYEYLARKLALMPDTPLRSILTLTPMPNRKADVNGIDLVGAAHGYPNGGYDLRDAVRRMHRSFALGMLWFLANDPRVPEHIRSEMSNWGLTRDEFPDSGGFSPRMYVREARRMLSDYVMTEHDARPGSEPVPDPVGLATYSLDSHRVSRFVDVDGKLREEGHFYERSGDYGVSYRSIRPRKAESTNLLVPVALSASHVAYGSIRMEPVYMVLGQSAGTAAVMSLNRGVPVQDLPYAELRKQLDEDGQVLGL